MPLRYAALRAARFFWTSRPDVVAKKDVAAGVALLLDDGNLADLAIDDLRKWGRWEVADLLWLRRRCELHMRIRNCCMFIPWYLACRVKGGFHSHMHITDPNRR